MNLPEIFQNKNIKIVDKGQDLYYGEYSNNKHTNAKPTDIRNDIRNLFTSKSYVYKIAVIITLKNKTIDTYVVGKNANHLITIDNELIPIKDILDIKEKGN